MKLGILFAGQGSQAVGMGKDWYENNEEFREVFDLLSQAQRAVAFEGPLEALTDTRNTQPIMVAFAAGITAVLKKELQALGIKPQMAAGLSLGEYSALHAAGVFDAETAVQLVTKRAEAMSKAAEGVECKMYAVLGLGRETVEKCCKEAEATGLVQVANDNCPGQIVIAGEAKAADYCCKLAEAAGAKRCMPLAVSGPFHTAFMEPAGEVLKEVFRETEFGPMEFPVIFNCIGREKREEETVADLLVRQVSHSVYFKDSIEWMAEAGIDTIIEVGPGKVLSGFVRKTCRQIRCLNLTDYGDLQEILQQLKEGTL